MPTSKNVVKTATGWRVSLPVTPVPAARPRIAKWGTYYPPSYQMFRKAAAAQLQYYKTDDLYDGPIVIQVTFVCARPAKPSKPYPRGDIDNYEKAFYDAITKAKCIWKDDAQIMHARLQKRYAQPGETPHIIAILERKM